jgi:hypothetical protein
VYPFIGVFEVLVILRVDCAVPSEGGTTLVGIKEKVMSDVGLADAVRVTSEINPFSEVRVTAYSDTPAPSIDL